MSVQPKRKRHCRWTYDEDIDAWETECGDTFCFIMGGPAENNVRFCHYCGKPLLVVQSRERA